MLLENTGLSIRLSGGVRFACGVACHRGKGEPDFTSHHPAATNQTLRSGKVFHSQPEMSMKLRSKL